MNIFIIVAMIIVIGMIVVFNNNFLKFKEMFINYLKVFTELLQNIFIGNMGAAEVD